MTPKPIEIHFLDVGHGDSILIRLPDDSVIMIDSNAPARSVPPASLSVLERWAKERGRKDIVIDLLCLTHFDQDHYRGMTNVLDQSRVLGLILPAETNQKEFSQRFNEQMEKFVRTTSQEVCQRLKRNAEEFEGLVRRLKSVGQQLHKEKRICERADAYKPLGNFGGADVTILGPTQNRVDPLRQELIDELLAAMAAGHTASGPDGRQLNNELSCILWLNYGNGSLLLTGDATLDSLEEAVNAYRRRQAHMQGAKPLRLNLLKVPHHGSRHSSRAGLWPELLEPRSWAIVSAGRRRPKHPDLDTLKQLSEVDSIGIRCTNPCEHRNSEGLDAYEEEALCNENGLFLSEAEQPNGHCVFHMHFDGRIEPVQTPDIDCEFHC